ncbi:MAG TPA: protein kinase, partial [Nannocystaceae bacterium]|nr:protein kinase [Nannocystaceae bacterium]
MRALCPDLDIPPDPDALVAAALAFDPDDRIPTALAPHHALSALEHRHPADTAPALLDRRYEVLDLLGRGATAEVHRAYDRDAARHVALKRLRPDAPADARRRLRLEARALSAVQHPALPRLHEAHLTDPHGAHLVLSLTPGRPATDFCLAGRTLKLAEVVAAGRQLADALVALHDRGILHRDLNAANVLIDRGPDLHATLIDLGMAELTPRYYAVAEPRYLTPPEGRMSHGTETLRRLDWTAPEVRAGQPYTDRSDLFSLALLLWRLLTGTRPSLDPHPEAHRLTPPPPPPPPPPLAPPPPAL